MIPRASSGRSAHVTIRTLLRRLDDRRFDPREIERDAELMAFLGEAAALRERETLGIVIGDDGLDHVERTLMVAEVAS